VIDEDSARLAVRNVATRGDTDVFPYPFDNHVFFDREDQIVEILLRVGSNLSSAISEYPISSFSTMTNVSYGGFRWVTQIDPVWNAFLLGSVLASATTLESERLAQGEGVVFSYRYEPSDDGDKLFRDGGWKDFQEETRRRAADSQFVVAVDIADFYARIYHHRIENALLAAGYGQESVRQIKVVLSSLSNNASYGLPVGGPAARLLSELTLNRTDRLAWGASGIGTFARYADDYRFFTRSLAEAHRAVGFISETLLRNEGLTLQKAKTRIMSRDEYLETLDPLDSPPGSTSDFMRLHIHFDPYSPTAEDDYEELKSQLNRFDILALLGTELRKGQVHSALTRRLLTAVTYLEPEMREQALLSLSESFDTLAPVMPQTLMALRRGLVGLDEDFAERIHGRVRALIDDGNYLADVDLNVAYIVRLLSDRMTAANERALVRLFNVPHGFTGRSSPCVKRDIVVAMANARRTYWLSNLKNDIRDEHAWVRRAFVASTPLLRDEGEHWFRSAKRGLPPIDHVVQEWANAKVGADPGWRIPS
jgi:hypothetical protein